MRKSLSLAVTLLLSWISIGYLAQAQGAARLLFFSVRPGAKSQFEQAIKLQMEARRANDTSWRWLAWEYVSGEVPRYCIATFGHAWTDFDQAPEAGDAEEARLAAAAALSAEPPRILYFEHLEEVSDFGSATNTPALAEISLYQVRYGKTSQFYGALRDFHEALSNSGNEQRFEWFELRSGGDTPQFMLMVPRSNWAALEVDAAEFMERLEKALGKDRARATFERFTSAVQSHQRHVVRLRPDLSLLPPADG